VAPTPDAGVPPLAPGVETPTLCFRGGRQVAVPPGDAVVGRDETADIIIPAEDARYVSRRHARLSRDRGTVVVTDLGSANGTLVNGKRIDRATLAAGDEVQFGRHGPVATYFADLPPTGFAAAAAESPSAHVRRAVSAAMASNRARDRRRLAIGAIVTIAATTLIVVALVRSGVLVTDPADPFAQLAAAYEGRVALIEVGVTQAGKYFSLGVGSGFFASDDGLVVTNKHVVRPELFAESIACTLGAFERFGAPIAEITLWPGGTRFRRDATGAGDRSLGYSTSAGSLTLVATADDTLLPPAQIACTNPGDGTPFRMTWQQHAADNNDLALLRVTLDRPVSALPLASREAGPGDMVMVYGFPSGFGPLEGLIAEPIFRVGSVLRVRETIQTDAVVLHGNSGGPLINAAGEVVGVATRGPAESLNSAIRVEHVRRLLLAATGP